MPHPDAIASLVDARKEYIAENRRQMLAQAKAIPGNKVTVKIFKGGRWREIAGTLRYPYETADVYYTFELRVSGRKTTYSESDVQERVLDALQMYAGGFPEYFPHTLGESDEEPIMGEVSYDGYEPTPTMHPQGP